ncbi:MAG: response regulator [Acidobacteria bacterium]|nr:response regulator [Acidobacteriota bacterium]MBV9475576.1 response regulator [Acidobacteriota bacterium]
MRREKRILIVDDDDAIRALLATVLRRRGLRVDSARNGEQALESLASCRYVLMVLDLMMPRVSGYEVIEHLGTVSPDLRPVVIVLTAGIEQRSFNPNIVIGTIHKPFDIELFIDTVEGCLTALSDQLQLDDCHPANPRTPEETKAN